MAGYQKVKQWDEVVDLGDGASMKIIVEQWGEGGEISGHYLTVEMWQNINVACKSSMTVYFTSSADLEKMALAFDALATKQHDVENAIKVLQGV